MPAAAGVLRRVALHEETAALLHQRAERAPTEEAASSLRRRAAEHARQAADLRAGLTARRRTAPPARQDEVAGS